MTAEVLVVAGDAVLRQQLVGFVEQGDFQVVACTPDALPERLPAAYVIALPALDTTEETLIKDLRSHDQTAQLPIALVSTLPMEQLQSVEYIASDWTIAIVPEPPEQAILLETLTFLLAGTN